MAYDRFLIGFVDGNASLQTDLRPFLINDNAFSYLQNLYVFRGRVRKRFGSKLMGVGFRSSLDAPLFSRVNTTINNVVGQGIIDGAGNAAGFAPGLIWKIGQQFQVYNYLAVADPRESIFTVYQAAGAMLSTGTATGTFNTATGAYTIAGARPGDTVFFYPAEPIMGITLYDTQTNAGLPSYNNQISFAFDTQFAFFFNGFSWVRSGSGVTPLWHGTDTNFMWTCNWTGITDNVIALIATNFNAHVGVPVATDDPIWWTFDGTTWTSGTGINAFYFNPAPGTPPVPIPRFTGPYVKTARIIVPFKNRLVLLGTIENDNPAGNGTGGTNKLYANRCRYSHNGSPFAQNAWYEPNQMDSSATPNNLSKADGAGFIDASTDEAIVSAEFNKDRLIVFFQRSTWELAYTGNQVLPFVWQKLNTELGSQSQFSSVPFDKEILTVGNTGIHSCNGVNVVRIDNKIPDEIFEIGNVGTNESTSRTAGIRDFFVEQVYWTFASSSEHPLLKFPDQVLVYNYKTGAWGLNDDCITAFGYFMEQSFLTWATTLLTWENANFEWNTDNEAPKFREVLAGNQQGYIYIIDADISRNSPVMQITQMANTAPNITLTVIDHTLAVGNYVLIENAQGVTGVNNNIYKVVSLGTNPDQTGKVVVGPGSFVPNLPPVPPETGYKGGGTLTRVSNTQFQTKQYNFYLDKANDVYIAKVDFGVLKTSAGEVTIDYFPNASELSMLSEAAITGTNTGNGVLETRPYDPNIYPFEQVQDRLWHSIYFQTEGNCIQLYLYMSHAQMTTPAVSLSEFELDGMVFYVQPSGRLE